MANVLDKYGIKEVCDITFYEINEATGKPGNPVLYIDTAKVSTLEQAAESVDATGGKGNVPLITWDYGRDITITLEDALFSARSLEIMFGANAGAPAGERIAKTLTFTATKDIVEAPTPSGGTQPQGTVAIHQDGIFNLAVQAGCPTYWEGPDGKTHAFLVQNSSTHNWEPVKYESTSDQATAASDGGNLTTKPVIVRAKDGYKWGTADNTTNKTFTGFINGEAYFITFEVQYKSAMTIDITSSNFPGTYYVTGDTYARSEKTGTDSFFQLIIPKAKVLSEDVSLTMEAEGDPSTFQMNLKVLRNQEANQKGMVQLVKYELPEGNDNDYARHIWSYVDDDSTYGPQS